MRNLLLGVAALLSAAPAAAANFTFDFTFSRDQTEIYTGAVTLNADDGTAEAGGTRYVLSGASGSITPNFNSDPAVYTVVGLSDFFGLADNTLLLSGGVISYSKLALQVDGGPGEFLFEPAEGRVGAFEGRFDLDSASLVPASVPEPATWATMFAGFALAGVVLRRRRMASAYAA